MTPEERFDANRGLVYHISRRYKVPEEDREDMIQEGFLALWRACRGYDDTRGEAFSTYAGAIIARTYSMFTKKAWNSSGLSAGSETIIRAYKASQELGDDAPDEYKPLMQTALSTDYYVNRDEDEGATLGDELLDYDEYDFTDEERRVILSELYKRLTPRRRALVMRKFGLNGNPPQSYRQMAAVYGVTHEAVRCMMQAALRRLRESDVLAELTEKP